MIDKNSQFWKYLSDGQKGLVTEGFFLVEDTKAHPDTRLTDYSYLVFPFAKAYEGFLKQLFLDKAFINEHQYQSTHLRIGKILNPNLRHHLGKGSVYNKIVDYCRDYALADEMWDTWKEGRNLLFHYFPHNLKAVTLEEAEQLVNRIVQTMEKSLKMGRV